MAQIHLVEKLHISHILSIATNLYYDGNYANFMMAIPNAVAQWEKEHRAYCAEFQDPEYEIAETIAHIKAEITIAFQFPEQYNG